MAMSLVDPRPDAPRAYDAVPPSSAGWLSAGVAFGMLAPVSTGTASAARVEALLAELEAEDEPRLRAVLLLEVARALGDELDDPVQAADAALEAFQTDPTAPEVLDVLEPLLRATGTFPTAVEVVLARAGEEREPKRRLAFAEALVRWSTREVSRSDVARSQLGVVRALDATHPLVHLAQAAIYREQGDLRRELEALDMAVLSSKRADDRARVHLLMADRYGDARDVRPDLAKKHFGKAHELFPKSMAPLLGLERLAEQQGDVRALADVLRRQAEADVSDRERVALLLRLAGIEEREFKKPEQAASTLERVFLLDPEDEDVLAALERAYTSARAWERLATFLESAAALADDPEKRASRLGRLGEVLETRLSNLGAAIAAYERLGAIHTHDETVLGELARLCEKAGRFDEAARYREELAELTVDLAQRARLLVVAGQLLAVRDGAASEERFARAFAADPTNQAAFHGLVGAARGRGDTSRVAALHEQRAHAAGSPRARAAALVELAELRRELGDLEAAEAAFEQAIGEDPENEAAAVALFEPLVADGRLAEAAAFADRALAAAERSGDPARLFAARRSATKVALALGEHAWALELSLGAYDLAPDAPEARQELVEVAAAVGERHGASPPARRAELRRALTLVAESLETLDLGTRVALAACLRDLGESDLAEQVFDHALAEAPGDPRGLAGLASLKSSAGSTVAAFQLRRQLAHTLADPVARFEALVACARAFADSAKRADLAAEVFEEARALDPRHLPTLHRLLALYQELERWPATVAVLRAIADVDTDPVRRSRSLLAAGQVAREKLADREGALAAFDAALDVDEARLATFDRISQGLTEDRDWLGLERMYKRMLLRSVGHPDPSLSRALYHQLGLVYRDRLGDPEAAIGAFKAALELAPDAEEDRVILRELYARAGKTEGAVAVTLGGVLADPLDPRPYPALFDLLSAQGDLGRAFRVASVMAALGVNHAPAHALRAHHPPVSAEHLAGALGQDGLRMLAHPELEAGLGAILEIVAPAAVELALSRLGARQRFGYPGPALKNHVLEPMVQGAAQALGVAAPKLHSGRVGASLVAVALTRTPALLVEPTQLAGVSREALVFVVGKRVAQLAGPYLARALSPSFTELEELVRRAVRIGLGRLEPGDEALRGHLRKPAQADLAIAVERAVSRHAKLDVRRWASLVDVTLSRAGLLLAGDVDAARQALAIEPQLPGDLTPRDKLRDLAGFFLGDLAGELRRRLGVALPPRARASTPPPASGLPVIPVLPSLRPPRR